MRFGLWRKLSAKELMIWTVVLEMTLESSLDCKEIQQSMPKEISPGCSLEGLMLKLKLQYFGHLMWRVYSLENSLMLGRAGAGEKGTTEDKMIGWHHRLDGLESEWTPGVGDGQGGLACCDSWGLKESDMSEWLNWTELNSFSLLTTYYQEYVQWIKKFVLTYFIVFYTAYNFCL